MCFWLFAVWDCKDTRVRHFRTSNEPSFHTGSLRYSGAPLFYGQNDAARCSFRSKSQVKALLHPYGTVFLMGAPD